LRPTYDNAGSAVASQIRRIMRHWLMCTCSLGGMTYRASLPQLYLGTESCRH
jgi:hypothetical protein